MSDIIKTDKDGKWLTSLDMQERADLLKKTQLAVLSNSAFFPVFTNGCQVEHLFEGSVLIRGRGKFVKSWCNFGSREICRQMGIPAGLLDKVFSWYDDKKKIYVPTIADNCYDNLIREAIAGTVLEITEDESRYLASIGLMVIVVARTNNLPEAYGQSGHVSTAYPMEQADLLMIANVGGVNCVCKPMDKRSFGGAFHNGKYYLTPLKYFHVPYENNA